MNIRVIISDAPGVKLAEDHRDLTEVAAMAAEDVKAWIDGLIETTRTRGGATVKAAGKSGAR